MARRSRKPPPPGGISLRAAFYGAVLLAIGFSVGVLAGSLLETPRLLMEWARGPVERVELEPVPGVAAAAPESEPHVWAPPVPPPPQPQPQARAPVSDEPPAPEPARRPHALEEARQEARQPAAPERAADVLEELEREVAGRAGPAPAAAAPPAAPAEDLVVQVASTTDAAEAQRLVERLRGEGFDAFSTVMQPGDGARRHRVRVRPAGGVLAADVAERLRSRGYATWITPGP